MLFKLRALATTAAWLYSHSRVLFFEIPTGILGFAFLETLYNLLPVH
jgi:hypothetical protein